MYVNGGRVDTGIDVMDWVKEAESRGAGEIVLNVMNADGTTAGYDLEMTAAVSEAVKVPVVASGGAGSPEHMFDVLTEGKADAALAAQHLSLRDVYGGAGEGVSQRARGASASGVGLASASEESSPASADAPLAEASPTRWRVVAQHDPARGSRFEVLGDGAAELFLRDLRLFAGVERHEVVLVGHRVELLDQLALVGDEAVVQVVAVVHVHAAFPVVHLSGCQDARDEVVHADSWR